MKFAPSQDERSRKIIKLSEGNCRLTPNSLYLEGAKEEENQRLQCESKRGIFTRYAKKEYDFICDYRLKYGDLKKVFQKAGLQFEVRNEPLQVAVVVLGEEKPKKKLKKPTRVPSSVKKRLPQAPPL